MTTNSDLAQNFSMTIDGLQASDIIAVTAVSGREAISELYAFDVWFTSEAWLRPRDIVGKNSTVTVTCGVETLVIKGIVTQFDCYDPTQANIPAYHLVVGPRFALADLNRRNLTFGTGGSGVTIADLIDAKLSAGIGGSPLLIDTRFQQTGYPKRDYVAQFRESDFTFLTRNCEHYGVFFFFEFDQPYETLVFGDGNNAFKALNPASLAYGYTSGPVGDATVSSLRETSRPVPNTVEVSDYDDMQTSPIILGSADLQGDAWGRYGTTVEYGTNLTALDGASDTDLGTWFATIRAQEQAVRRTVYSGVSTAVTLRPGTYFTLTGHPNAALGGKVFLVTAVQHGAGATPNNTGPYQNQFEAVMLDASLSTPVYRPARTTARPSLGGLFNATVESTDPAAKRADLDAYGRYKVRHAFDQSEEASGSASARVRQSQPYGGANDTGLQMPLLAETGVVVGYVNGDPDRPLIVGAVPNARTPSVVSETNRDLNRLRTQAGGLIEINDGDPARATTSTTTGTPPYLRIAAQSPPALDFARTSYLRLGSYVDDADEASLLPTNPAPKPAAPALPISRLPQVTTSTTSATTYDSAKDQAAASGTDLSTQTTTAEQIVTVTATPVAPATAGNGVLLFSAQDLLVNVAGSAYLKYGKGYGAAILNGDAEIDVPDGRYSLNTQNGISLTAGTSAKPADINLTAYNQIQTTAHGPVDSTTYGNSRTVVHGDSHSEIFGSTFAQNVGETTTLYLGATDTWYLDADVTGKFAASATLFIGINFTLLLGGLLNVALGKVINFSVGSTVNCGLEKFSYYNADTKLVAEYTRVATSQVAAAVTALETKITEAKTSVTTATSTQIKAVEDGIQARNAQIDAEIKDITTSVGSLGCYVSELQTYI